MKVTIMCFLAAGARAATVLVGGMNCSASTHGSFDCSTTLWSVNTQDGSSSVVADLGKPRYSDFVGPVGSSVVCGSSYYYVWQTETVHGRSAKRSAGITVLDLTNGGSYDLVTSSWFIALACDPNHADKLLGISINQSAWNDVIHLKSYDPATQTEAVIGSFPQREGYDYGWWSKFFFTQDGSEVWANWIPDADHAVGKRGGYVDIMDTSSGEIKISAALAFSGEEGTPAALLPDAKRGIFETEHGLKWADVDVTDGRVTAKIGSPTSAHMNPGYGKLQPPQMCGSHVFYFDTDYEDLSLYDASPADGVVINAVKLTAALNLKNTQPGDISALACLSSSTEDIAFV